jgi:hypothetical protein
VPVGRAHSQQLSPNIGVSPDEAALTTAYSFGDDSSYKAVASLQKDLLGDLPSRKAIDELLRVFFDPSGPAGPSLCKSMHAVYR